MKILQTFDFLSLPHGGGTVDIVYKLSKALSARGHEVTICTGDFELDQEYIDTLGDTNVRVFHSWINRHGIYMMLGLVRFDIRCYDVIHLHCYRSLQNAMICCKAINHNVPYIIDAHGSAVDLPGRKQALRKAFDVFFGRDILRQASRVIAETEIGVAEYEKLGVSTNKIRLLHPLLDTAEYSSLPKAGLFRHRYGISAQFVILFVGRIHREKGIETLVRATRQLIYNGLDISLVVVGQDDGFMTTLRGLATDLNIGGRVLFTGFLSGEDKLSALVDADVLVQPSKNEAGARPSLEAILCGTPVIVSKDTGAGNEIAKMNGGWLVPYGNINRMSFAIQWILAFPDRVEEQTQDAKRYILENLSLDKQISNYEKIYQEVIA